MCLHSVEEDLETNVLKFQALLFSFISFYLSSYLMNYLMYSHELSDSIALKASNLRNLKLFLIKFFIEKLLTLVMVEQVGLIKLSAHKQFD